MIRISVTCLIALCLLAALLLAGTALGEVSREGLVGEWHFDGDAKDSSGNGKSPPHIISVFFTNNLTMFKH